METKLYIGNMSYDTTEEQLRAMFSEAGTVGTVDIIKDRVSGRPKGFAFISMSSQAEAEKAISMFNGYTLNNRELRVNPARPREEAGGGGFGGRRNSGFGRGQGGPGGGRDRRGGGPRRY